MNDDFDVYKALSESRRQSSKDRRRNASNMFEQARSLAAGYGFDLIRFSESHYQLKFGPHLLNVYPGNQRLYMDPSNPKAFVEVGKPWNLVDVVEAARRSMGIKRR